MNNEHPVENLMKSTMENLRDMIDVNTVVGDAVETRDGSYIVPISKVTFGFASGGSEFSNATKLSQEKDNRLPFGGGSGAGVTVKPVAFLVVKEDSVRLLPVNQDNTYDRIVDSVPQVLDMFKGFYNEMKNNKSNTNESTNNSNTSTNTNTDANSNTNANTADSSSEGSSSSMNNNS